MGMGLGQGDAASQQPVWRRVPGHPGRINSAHVRLGLEVGDLLPSNPERPIKVIFSGEGFEYYEVVCFLSTFYFKMIIDSPEVIIIITIIIV